MMFMQSGMLDVGICFCRVEKAETFFVFSSSFIRALRADCLADRLSGCMYSWILRFSSF